MSLQSKLFKGDPSLEMCLVHDSSHIMQGAAGDHVSKIQTALCTLDGLRIDPSELSAKRYGPSTAAAVLAFKRKRNIINRSYQTQADNIVGKMTIAALDMEMLAIEPFIQAVKAALDFGRQLCRMPGLLNYLGYFGPQLDSGLSLLETAYAAYLGSVDSAAEQRRADAWQIRQGLTLKDVETEFAQRHIRASVAAVGQRGPLIGVVVVDDIAILLILLLIVVVGALLILQTPAGKKAADDRAKELARILPRLVDLMRLININEARKMRADVKELDDKMEECKGKHLEQQNQCKEKMDAYEKAKNKYLQKLFILQNCLQNRGCVDVNRFFLRALEILQSEFIDALNELNECLGCDNF